MATLGKSMHARGHGDLSLSASERQRKFMIHFIVYLAVNIGLAALNFRKNPDHLWFYWVAGGWGLGVAFHAMRAFGLTGENTNDRNPRSGTDTMAGDEGI